MHRLAESQGYPINESPEFLRESSIGETEPPNIVAAMWRYRWAVMLPALLGAVVGFVIYLQMPVVYRSSSRLIVESGRSAMLDAVTGEVVGGVPSIEVLQSQLFGDAVFRTAWQDAHMVPFHDQFPGGFAEFVESILLGKALTLEPEFTDLKTAESLVMLLHFDSQNQEICEVGVSVFSDALQDFYNQKQKNSRSALLGYMSTATDRLYPDMRAMKEKYRQFRQGAPLQWDANGSAINPHRDHLVFLAKTRAELREQMRQLQTEDAGVKAVVGSTEDPEVAISVLGQLLQKPYVLPSERRALARFGEEDVALGQIRVERDLVPLMVELSRMTAEYGSEHPKVKTLSQQIEGLREELRKLVEDETERVAALMNRDEKQAEEAAEALQAISKGLATQLSMLQTQLKSLDAEINEENKAALELAAFEIQNEDMLAELEQQGMLIQQVEEQMARVELTEEESGIRVIELTSPSLAQVESPILIKNVGIGAFLGLMLGSGLAFLLEKNSNSFRNPEEIVELVGAPVLTHLPFFKGRLRKGRNKIATPFDSLDSQLAVVHAPASVAAEAMRACRTSVFFETAQIKGGKVIQVTSPLPSDGKSTVAGNLACSIAQSGKSTVIVDCDLRRPQMTDNFGVASQSGLTDVLDGRCDIADATHDTPISTLKIIPSGPIPANPAEALTMPEMGHLLEVLREKFDYVVVNSPPLLLVTDPSILASYTDAVLLVVKVRRKSKLNTKEAVKILRGVGANLLGVVVNNSDESGKSDGYQPPGFYRFGRQASRYRSNYKKSRSDSGDGKEAGAVVGSDRLASQALAESAVASDAVASNGSPLSDES